jgi:hypothetical protein
VPIKYPATNVRKLTKAKIQIILPRIFSLGISSLANHTAIGGPHILVLAPKTPAPNPAKSALWSDYARVISLYKT